jgi:hypothetical protein
MCKCFSTWWESNSPIPLKKEPTVRRLYGKQILRIDILYVINGGCARRRKNDGQAQRNQTQYFPKIAPES